MNDDEVSNYQHDPGGTAVRIQPEQSDRGSNGLYRLSARGFWRWARVFYTSWFDRRKEYKDGEFKAEFDEVVNALREKDGLLCSRASMNRFCCQHPEAEFEGNYCTEYGFKVQTSQHTYMLRCNLNYGDYNFYLYAYVARFF